jgi:hypothetical protein
MTLAPKELSMTNLARMALLWTAVTVPASAHPGGHDEEYYTPAPQPAPPPATVIPETYGGVVDALREHLTAAETARAAFKIVDLRNTCATMKDLAAAAPGKATALSAAAAATVATAVAHLQEQLAALTTAAESADVAGGDGAIAAIRADVDTLARFAT